MPPPSTPRAVRKKVRCPKCTARFSEPSKPVFECPVCSARLSNKEIIHELANGLVGESEGLASPHANGSANVHQAEEYKLQGEALHEDHEHSTTKGDGRAQHDSTLSGRQGEVLSPAGPRETEQQPTTGDRELSSLALESDYIKPDTSNGNEPQDSAKTEFISTSQSDEKAMSHASFTMNRSLDHAEKEGLEDNHVAGANKGVKEENKEERERPLEGKVWSLPSQILRNTRSDFSFKYALENASSKESGARPLNGKRSPRSRMPTDGSKSNENDLPSLRVRISNSHEECSELSDLERSSLECDTASHDGSESDFDFPAPSPDGAQEIRLPASFGQSDPCHADLTRIVYSMPHQLELVDSEESVDHGGYALPEPTKQFRGSTLEPTASDEDGRSVSEVEKGSALQQEKKISTVIMSQDGGVNKKTFLLDRVQNEARASGHVLEGGVSDDMPQHDNGRLGLAIDKEVQEGASPNEKMDDSLSPASTGRVEHVTRGLVSPFVSSVPSRHTDMKDDLYGRPHVLQPYDGEYEGQRQHTSVRHLPRSNNRDVVKDSNKSLKMRGLGSVQETKLFNWKGHGSVGPHPTTLHGDGSSANFTHPPQMDMASFTEATSLTAEPPGSAPMGLNHHHTHHIPPHPLMLPGAMPNHANHALTRPGYHHIISPICMICTHHQHSHLQPQMIPPCTLCYNQSGSMPYSSGHGEHLLSPHGPGSAYASSSSGSSRAHSSSKRVGLRNDISMLEPRVQASSPRRADHYPPLPEGRAAPYVTCRGCSRVLKVPPNLPQGDATIQRIRCGACTKISKFSIHNNGNLRSKEFGLRGKGTKVRHYGPHGRQILVTTADQSYHQALMGASPELHREDVNKPGIVSSSAYKNSLSISNVVNQKNVNAMSFADVLSQKDENAISSANVVSPKNEALRGGNGSHNSVGPFHSAVDEKEEGLDFGAPRISDGDSWDHSERSPENYQAIPLKHFDERSHAATLRSPGTPSIREREAEHMSEEGGSEEDDTAPQQKRPGSPLLVLLNQESTRFNLRLDPRVALYESTSASPSSSTKKGQPTFSSHGHRSEHHVSKGPKYIAGLLRRSLRDFGKGGK